MTGFYNETSSNETKLREFVSFDVTSLRRDPDFIRSERLALTIWEKLNVLSSFALTKANKDKPTHIKATNVKNQMLQLR